MEMKSEVLSVLVDNNSGVLARVANLFSQRGYNIDSLTVSATNDPKVSRITIVVQGDEDVIEQIIKQTFKLHEVRNIYVIDAPKAIQRELLLIKLKLEGENLRSIHEIANIYKASIVDLSRDSVVIELTGKPGKIDGFIDVAGQYEIIEMCRTGVTAIERGITAHEAHKVV